MSKALKNDAKIWPRLLVKNEMVERSQKQQ
jgi:hypothetical protein